MLAMKDYAQAAGLAEHSLACMVVLRVVARILEYNRAMQS